MNPSIEEVQHRLKRVLLSNLSQSLNSTEIHAEVALLEDGLALDSIALLEFVVGIENEFGLLLDESTLSTESFESLTTIAHLVHSMLGQHTEA